MKLDVYLQIINSFNVNYFCSGNDSAQFEHIDLQIRKNFVSSDAYSCFKEVFRKHACATHLSKIKDSFELYYYFYKAKKPFADGTIFFCIGPIRTIEPSSKFISSLLQKNKISSLMASKFTDAYTHVPLKEDLFLFEETLLALSASTFDPNLQLTELPGTLLDYSPKQDVAAFQPAPFIEDTIDNFYKLENLMMDAITNGDAKEALHFYFSQETLTFKPRPGNPLSVCQGRFLVLNVLCRKAIEKSGVPPLYIDSISSEYCIRISKATSITEFNHLPEDMISSYCDYVKMFTLKNYPPLIQKCIIYIQQHYAENPSLTQIADVHFVSKQYLSTLFKKETHQNLTDYLHECQMKHGAELLCQTTLPISKIAELCGQTEVSYFTKLFKNTYHISPREFRKNQ